MSCILIFISLILSHLSNAGSLQQYTSATGTATASGDMQLHSNSRGYDKMLDGDNISAFKAVDSSNVGEVI